MRDAFWFLHGRLFRGLVGSPVLGLALNSTGAEILLYARTNDETIIHAVGTT